MFMVVGVGCDECTDIWKMGKMDGEKEYGYPYIVRNGNKRQTYYLEE